MDLIDNEIKILFTQSNEQSLHFINGYSKPLTIDEFHNLSLNFSCNDKDNVIGSIRLFHQCENDILVLNGSYKYTDNKLKINYFEAEISNNGTTFHTYNNLNINYEF